MSKEFNHKVDSGVDIVTVEGISTGNSGTGEREFSDNIVDRAQGHMMTYEGGKVSEHGADVINTYQDSHMTAFNKFGNPTTMKDALADPENTSIMVGRLQVKTSVAIRQGLISDNGEFNQASIETPKPAESLQTKPFVSEDGQNFIRKTSKRVPKQILDGAVAKLFLATGMEGKQDAAINHFANEIGVEPERGEKIANTLIKDVLDTTEKHLAEVFNDPNAASAFMNLFVNRFDPTVRSNILLRLYRGDRSAVQEILKRIDDKKYF